MSCHFTNLFGIAGCTVWSRAWKRKFHPPSTCVVLVLLNLLHKMSRGNKRAAFFFYCVKSKPEWFSSLSLKAGKNTIVKKQPCQCDEWLRVTEEWFSKNSETKFSKKSFWVSIKLRLFSVCELSAAVSVDVKKGICLVRNISGGTPGAENKIFYRI